MKHLWWFLFKEGTEQVEVGTGRVKVTMSFSTQGNSTTFAFSPHPGKIKQACSGNTLDGILKILEKESRAVLAKAFPWADVASWKATRTGNGEETCIVFTRE